MYVEKSIKVKLTQEEQECLEEAKKIIDEIDMSIRNCDCNCEIEYENDIDYLLDEMQATIKHII